MYVRASLFSAMEGTTLMWEIQVIQLGLKPCSFTQLRPQTPSKDYSFPGDPEPEANQLRKKAQIPRAYPTEELHGKL